MKVKKKMNTLSKHIWEVTLFDAGDGSGDAFLPLPDELMAIMGWAEDDVLSFEMVDNYLKVSKSN